tara:strand:- start:810 stop:971 length:162 start_codon:yes stop_codon:yes gene_type:complete
MTPTYEETEMIAESLAVIVNKVKEKIEFMHTIYMFWITKIFIFLGLLEKIPRK